MYEICPASHCGKAIVNLLFVPGCQTITEMTRIESDKDAAISKGVKESFLKDKAVDLTSVNVKPLTVQSI